MNNHLRTTKLLAAIALVGGFTLSGCINDDYDFDEVDATIGIGGGRLTLPSSSTDTIKLSDVLEVNDDDCIKIMDNGDYTFYEEGDPVDPSHPEIDKILMSQNSDHAESMPLVASGGRIIAEANMRVFDYTGDKPDEVEELITAYTDGGFSFSIQMPSGLAATTPVIEELVISLSSCMTLRNVQSNMAYSQQGNSFTFTNVSPSATVSLIADITELDEGEGDAYGSLTVNGDDVDLTGIIHVSLNASTTAPDGSLGMELGSTFDMDDFYITGAYGRFDPDIDMTDLGRVEVTGVPDFLTDESVCIDLYNPQIVVDVKSDLDIDGFVSGTLRAYRNGRVRKEVLVPEMPIRAGGLTKICICRTTDGLEGDYDHVEVVEDLSTLIEQIPDSVTFEAETRANSETECDFILGHEYTVEPSYYMSAPLTFAEKAVILYKDTLDGWNGDIEDYELAEDAYIEVTANIENRVPAYLTLTTTAIDVDGNIMSDDDIAIDVDSTVIASPSGTESVVSPLVMKITQKQQGAMSRLDGIVLNVQAAASDGNDSVTGVTLNSEKHFIIVKDMKITLVGRIIADFN